MKILIAGFLIASVGFCSPRCDEEVPSESFSFPDNISEIIPYQDGDQFKLIHNEGTELLFDVGRESTEEEYHCDHCCEVIIFDHESLFITSDYPFVDLRIELQASDESYLYYVVVGNDSFDLTDHENLETFDSVRVNGHLFQDVFKLKSQDYSDINTTEFDSLYYSFAAGIIKVIQNNGDTYEVQ